MTSQAPPTDKKALGRRRLSARRRRVARIRPAVAAAAVSVFIALFSTVYVQMASGNDPVLAAQSTTSVASSTPTASSTEETTSSEDESTETEAAAETETETETSEPAAVTTAQS